MRSATRCFLCYWRVRLLTTVTLYEYQGQEKTRWFGTLVFICKRQVGSVIDMENYGLDSFHIVITHKTASHGTTLMKIQHWFREWLDPVLTQIYAVKWRHYGIMSQK